MKAIDNNILELYKNVKKLTLAKNLALHQFDSRTNICEKLHLKYRNKTMAIVHISAIYMFGMLMCSLLEFSSFMECQASKNILC